jgi:hypothetical protein
MMKPMIKSELKYREPSGTNTVEVAYMRATAPRGRKIRITSMKPFDCA